MLLSANGREQYVIFVRLETPDVWQRIASFASADRARQFAEVENDMLLDDGQLDDDVKEPLIPPEAPESGLPRLRAASAAEKARVGVGLISDAAASDGMSVEISVAPKKRGGYRRGMASAETAANKVWRVLAEAENEKLSTIELAARAGIPTGSVGYARDALLKLGIIQRIDMGEYRLLRMPDGEAPSAEPNETLAPEDSAEIEAEEDEEEPTPAPPRGVILTADECTAFRKMWKEDASSDDLAEKFLLNQSEVKDIAHRLGLPKRAAATVQ